MGILDKFTKKSDKASNTTKEFYFGSVEAEGENIEGASTLEYFKDYLGVLSNLKKGKFIFSGRKGVGKSAIAKYIKDTSDESEESFATLVRISDFDLESSIQLPEDTDDKEKLIFEWLILVNIVRLIVSNDCGQFTQEYKKLQKFLDMNAGVVNIDKYEATGGQKNQGGEVTFGGVKHVFGGVFKRYFNVDINKAPFYKLIPPLREIVKIMLDYEVNRDLEFWILFDDLDINFDVEKDEDNNKLMELIRISKTYNNEIFKDNKAKVLLFLRDDIKDALESKYPDSAKTFNTYDIPINWYDHQLYNQNQEEKIPLRQLANRRIKINFKRLGISHSSDPWQSLFAEPTEGSKELNGKSTFKYVLDFTFYRPRDIITFLNTMEGENYPYPISPEVLKELLKKYIKINVKEVKSELKLHFTEEEIEIIFNSIFPFVNQHSHLTEQNLVAEIESYNFNYPGKKVVDILHSYNLLLYKDDKGNLFFRYRGNEELTDHDKSQLWITLPKCIYHHYRRIN